ncbi:MAG TPA: sigma-54 dependent transcriptional regulator [Thermoanaerobaculia bacterium]|jgi:DNA-binding NtrC family response regulator
MSTTPPTPRDWREGWRRLGVVADDVSMEEPYRRLLRFAPQPVNVLLLGPSGSGKEALARAVHALSPCGGGPFVAVNVPAVPGSLFESELFGHARGAFTGADRDRAGLFEEASGGTLFLDEVGDVPLSLQPKLLRALQDREVRRLGESRQRRVDVRVVSATSRDLPTAAEAGRFREDLYYRLSVAVIRLPPLADRGRDAAMLARHFLERYASDWGRGRLRFSEDALSLIAGYGWPGNVRELENAVAQAAALADRDGTVAVGMLPDAVRGRPGRCASSWRDRMTAHRRGILTEALSRSGGNRSQAARDLGISRQALCYLLKRLEVGGTPPRRRP